MSGRRRREDERPGFDSFLDIVANLVGILVILVMVIGVRAKEALVDAAATPQSAAVTALIEEDQSALAAANSQQIEVQQVTDDVHQLQEKIADVQQETQLQHAYRGHLQALIAAATENLKQRRQHVDQVARAAIRRKLELNQSRSELNDLVRSKQVLDQQEDQPVVLKHIPTPLAKTVFGRELHFRLQDGRLVYVPMTELVSKLRSEWQEKLWKLKDVPEVTETIEGQQGFRMQYTLARKRIVADTPQGPVQREVMHVAGFELIPTRTDLGEPVASAVSPSGDFYKRVTQHDPEHTTVTVWTYPNSYGDFRRIKEQLFNMGYLTAGRPMPAGHPIGGSPQGSRSAAQ